MPEQPITPDSQPSDCPTPLSWQQVLEAFDEQSEAWEIDTPRGLVTGRSIGDGPPLVMLNPLLGNWQLMALAAWLLKDQFQVVLFDDSSLTHPRPRIADGSVDDLVEDLWSVCRDRELEPAIVLGTGLGSAVGLAALAQHEGRIAAAVLQGPVVTSRLTAPERWLTRLGSHLPGRLKHLPGYRSLMIHNHLPWFPPFDPSRLSLAIDVIGQLPLRIAARRARRLDQLDLGNCLEQLKHKHNHNTPPVLLIVPESLSNHSPTSQPTATIQIASHLNNVTVESLGGCGPLGCLTHPHRLTKLVRTFLNDSPAATPATPVSTLTPALNPLSAASD